MRPEKSSFQNIPLPLLLQHLRAPMSTFHKHHRAQTPGPASHLPQPLETKKTTGPASGGLITLSTLRLALPSSSGAGCFPRGADAEEARSARQQPPPRKDRRPPQLPGRERLAPTPGRRPADSEGGGGRAQRIFLPTAPPAPASTRRQR